MVVSEQFFHNFENTHKYKRIIKGAPNKKKLGEKVHQCKVWGSQTSVYGTTSAR